MLQILQVNPTDILNMLIIFSQISKIPEIYKRDKEIELHRMIKNIIRS